MRFSVTFCALLLVATTGFARAESIQTGKPAGNNQANSNKPGKPAGNNQASAAENVNEVLRRFSLGTFDDDSDRMGENGVFLENSGPGKGVGIARKTAEKNSINPSKDPKNPGLVVTVDKTNLQYFVGTPSGNSQTVVASNIEEKEDWATLVSLNPSTGKLISVTECVNYDKKKVDNHGRCFTVTSRMCDAVFPQSHLLRKKQQLIWECRDLLENVWGRTDEDTTVEQENIAKMNSIRPGLKVGDKRRNKRQDAYFEFYDLALTLTLCHNRNPGSERFDKVSNPQSQEKPPGLSEEAK